MDKSSRGNAPAIEAPLIGAGCLIAIAAVVWWATASARLETDRVPPASKRIGGGSRPAGFVGDRACAECHVGEFALHRRSGHSKTLQPAEETAVARWLDGQTLKDPELPQVTWSYALRDRRLSVERAEGGEVERFLIDYAFGSGNHASTFVSMAERDPRAPVGQEHRLTCYSGTKTLDVTPGHELMAPAPGTTPRGRSLSSLKLLRCFRCHTTVTSAEGRNVLDVATMIPNVTCERCHGPAQAHVQAARRDESELGMLMGPDRWTADSMMRSCGECHRHPADTPPASIRTDNIEIVRHQPVGLMQSKCYTLSRGSLSCVTCHDPHAPASRDRTRYEASCRSCHATAPQTICPVSPQTGCLDCHMPRRNSGQGILFTDHWIRIVGEDPEGLGSGQ